MGGMVEVLKPYLISFGFSDLYQGAVTPCSYSGFVLDLKKRWYLCSAAHNLDDVLARQARWSDLSNWHINYGNGAQTADKRWPYPFRFIDPPRLCLRSDEHGFDYCLIELESLAVTNLKHSGIRAFEITDIGYADQADIWFITGVPAETIQRGWRTRPPIALCAQGPHPPAARPADWEPGKSLNALFGQLQDAPDKPRPINNIAGMSGGGVLGLYVQEDKSAVVKLVGIQSGWSKDRRIVSVAPIAPFVKMILDELERQRSSASNEIRTHKQRART